MKIVIFNGSPNDEKGNTHVIAAAFAEGARKAGAQVEMVFLAKKKIAPCRGCFTCWLVTPGHCAVKDDMENLIPVFNGTDLVVFATPLYVDNVTGLMKNFMDRLVPSCDAHFSKDPGGECRHDTRGAKLPDIAVISNCGFPEQSHFQVLRLLFRRIARNMGSRLVAEIYRGGGALLAQHPLFLKPLVWRYKKLVEKAGYEVVKTGKISDDTAAKLEKPLMPDKYYIEGANKAFDTALAKIRAKTKTKN